jgi:putative SOS response-associated peptidase YedK
MGMHFAGLMYNARTDTLFTKPTFSRLANQGRSCVVALDGYFEWKASPLAGGKGKKQPYFVSRKQNESLKTANDCSTLKTANDCSKNEPPPYLLMPGLWTRVPTGLSDEPFLDTFTILTTEACHQIEWLHHRMPVCIWDLELAKKWLRDPSPKVHNEIDLAAKSNNEGFAWDMVTTEMSSIKFRGKEAIEPKKGPKPVSAFFMKMRDKSSPTHATKPSSPPQKRPFSPDSYLESTTDSSTPSKKSKKSQPDSPKKKGLITSFFQKKS